MRNQTLLLVCLVALLFGACKQEQIQPQLVENDDYSIAQLSDSVRMHKLSNDGNTMYVKEKNNLYYIADDITITDEQFKLLQKIHNPNTSTIERATIGLYFSKAWPSNTIPFRMPDQESLSDAGYEDFITNIHRAFDMVSAQTSIRFVERTTEPEYIQFAYSLTENTSPLGWSSNRVNQINIYNTDMPVVIVHEILHSLGFVHEQTRPDRDDYIIVNLDNVIPDGWWQYYIWFFNQGYGSFDFDSVMIYSSFAFAKDPTIPVMTKLDGSTFDYNLERMSPGDYAGINALYP